MYNTSSNIEDLDILTELNSFSSVGHAIDRSNICEFGIEHQDADFYVIMMNDSQEESIKELLKDFGFKAYLDYGNRIITI